MRRTAFHTLLGLVGLWAANTASMASADMVLVEAESFAKTGGWVTETSFIHLVGSPYLMAHGLGKPVEPATTTVNIPQAGTWHLWVRTKDWVAPWKAPGTPGRFQVAINDAVVPVEFGTEGADWHWQKGGEVKLNAGENRLSLVDLTGFDGRCDAIVLTTDATPPPNDATLTAQRKKWAGLPENPEDAGEFDLIVVGGGYGGLGAALSGARQALKVALIQDRDVLGGNGSSEVRVWANGATMRGKYPHLGEIVEEFADHAPDSPGDGEHYGDVLKEQLCRREPTLKLFLGHYGHTVKTDPKTHAITSVQALEVKTGRERIFHGKFFVDCTGHAFIGAEAGAEMYIQPKGHMGMSNMFYWQHEKAPQTWPATPWALPLTEADFPATQASRSRIDGEKFMKGEWFWESGFDKDPIKDLELMRDWNLRAVYGAFTAIRNGDHAKQNEDAALKWVAAIGGPRESRMIMGDVMLTRSDIIDAKIYPDGTVPTTWDIDLHYPKEQYAKKFPENPFISRAEFGAGVDRHNGYPIPYRCFYSKNVPNLFMAGRCISVNHDALGTIRVMRTCGMMGEVVGKAAYLCVRNETTPRGVYEQHLPELLALCNEPGASRRDAIDSHLYKDNRSATVTAYFNKGSDKVDGVTNVRDLPPTAIPVSSLKGIVVDDTGAVFTGAWNGVGSLDRFVGTGYRWSSPGKDTPATAKFTMNIETAGKYEVRLAWQPHENRATKTSCVIERAGKPPVKLRLNQRSESNDVFHSLGMFDFPAGEASITISTEGADGNVHADAVQLAPQGT